MQRSRLLGRASATADGNSFVHGRHAARMVRLPRVSAGFNCDMFAFCMRLRYIIESVRTSTFPLFLVFPFRNIIRQHFSFLELASGASNSAELLSPLRYEALSSSSAVSSVAGKRWTRKISPHQPFLFAEVNYHFLTPHFYQGYLIA